jgi:tetratricopeptide (TPR) repeat protein
MNAGQRMIAIQDVLEALSSPSLDAASCYRVGNVAQRAGDDTTAIVAYARGEAADPQYVWNYIALGQISARLGRTRPADEQLRRAVALQPTMQFLHYDLAMVELDERRPADALRDFNAELAISRDFKPALSGRVVAAARVAHSHAHVAAAPPAPRVSPTPTSSPSPAVSPTPSVAPTAKPTTKPTASPRATPVRVAANVQPRKWKPTVVPGRPQAPDDPAAPLSAQSVAAAPATQPPATLPPGTPPPTAMPPSVAADARAYLLAVSRDLNFTRALPAADPALSTSELSDRIRAATSARTWSTDDLLRLGTSALLSGRLSLAERAFDAASGRARADWRGPYLQALVARINGDDARARALLEEAIARTPRPEAYTSLAIVDLEVGNPAPALRSANQAVELDPSYGPGRFTAGMLALIDDDRETAANNLAAATSLRGAPARASYFFGLVSAH